MKKLYLCVLVFILSGLLFILCGCSRNDLSESLNSITPTDNSLIFNDSISDLSFSDLTELQFWFGSGAGAWCTVLDIEQDGTFTGYYHDSEMGDYGEDYPNGTRYECYFSGKFTNLKKIGNYEYSMKCEDLIIRDAVGKEEIIDGVKIIYSEPYGSDYANEFLLYLPGKKIDELPEEFLGWAHGSWENGVLTRYGLYNVEGKQGFI